MNALGPAFSGRSSRVRIDCSKVDISVQTFTLIDRGNAINRRQFLGTAAAGILAAPALLRQADAQEGPFRVKYYPVDSGMGSRDVTPAPDGTIWFCGQRNGTLGRLDPRDGSFKLIDLGKGAAPHGVIIGPDGAPG